MTEITMRYWTGTQTAVHRDTDENDQRANARCPPGRAGGIKARSISPSWSPQFAAPQWLKLTTARFFAPVSRTAVGNNSQQLEIYETKTPN